MRAFYRSIIPLLCLFSFASTGCEIPKGVAHGDENEIIVIADSTHWVHTQPALSGAFERKIFTPREESVFHLRRIPVEAFHAYRARKNIIMLGTLDSNEPVSQSVQGMLSTEVRAGVERGEYFVFTRENEWALGQTVMILVSTNEYDLAYYVRENRDALFSQFDEASDRHILRYLYDNFEKTDLSEKLLEKYRWTIRVQQEYTMRVDSAEINYVRFHNPSLHRNVHRWISVRWFDADRAAADSLLNEQWVKAQRDTIGTLFADPVKNNPDYDVIQKEKFLNYDAIRYDGVWQTKDSFFGGPFRSHVFFDEKTQRIYFIDTAVFFPKDDKEPDLRKMGVIAKTFRTAGQPS